MAWGSVAPAGRSFKQLATYMSIVRSLQKNLRALFEGWTILNVNIKEVNLLVVLGNGSLIINPDQ